LAAATGIIAMARLGERLGDRGSALARTCCGDHDWWIIPGLWMGAGRQGFVDYIDVILPNWLTMPLCLLFPALWYRRRRAARAQPQFEVVMARQHSTC